MAVAATVRHGSALTVHLVRHGLTDWNEDGRLMGRSDVPLNERGRVQAERAARLLAREPIARIYSSPQVRARQTAAPIADASGADVVLEPGFDEVWLSDAWMGKRVDELRGDEDLERVIEDPTHVCSALEPLTKVRDRVVAALDSLRGRYRDDEGVSAVAAAAIAIVIVSHGDPLRAIVAHHLGLGLDGIRRFVVDNGSVTSLRFGRRGPRLMYLNRCP